MSITVSKSTALKLKEAGWKKVCVFSYFGDDVYMNSDEDLNEYDWERWVAEAPTAQELLEELPVLIGNFQLKIDRNKNEIVCGYHDYSRNSILYGKKEAIAGIDEKNLAEALASLYLKLKKENLI